MAEETLTLFDYDKLTKAFDGNPATLAFLQANRTRLEEIVNEAGHAAAVEICTLFSAGKKREAWGKFYKLGSGWAALYQGSGEDVQLSAQMAEAWSGLATWLQKCGEEAERALLTILLGAFLG